MVRFLLGLLCCVAVGLAGCNKAAEPKGSSGAKPRYSIAVVSKGTTHEFWKTVESGAREAAARRNVEMHWDGPTRETEHNQQKAIFSNMLSLGVRGVALAPTDEEVLSPSVEAAMDKGVPVVIFDSNIKTDKYVSFVATDNEKGGRLAGEKLIELLGDKGGRVLLLRYTEGSGSTIRREEGFLKAIAAKANLKLEDKQFTDGTPVGAMRVAVNMLSTRIQDNRLEVDGVFASNEPTSLGMLQALDRLRKQGVQVNAKFVGFDSAADLIKAMQAGTVDALVVQNPKRMGELAVETLLDHIEGKKVAKYVDTGVEVVTESRLKDKTIRALVGLKDE